MRIVMRGLVLISCLAVGVLVGLTMAGCDNGSFAVDSGTKDSGGVGSSDSGLLGVGQACTDNSMCESNLCTKASYDRLPGPVCTYTCDLANPNPKCPAGCNMKGYCRLPM